MPVTTPSPFSADAIEANRRGELSDTQRRNFGALSTYKRKSALRSAAFFVAGAVLIGFFASPTYSVVARASITLICLAIAAFLIVRSITGSDALTRDLRQVQVHSVEGAIGKRRLGRAGGARSSTFFLDVGDRSFKVARVTYAAAPEAGFVRLYFLPHSRKVVNLEQLPNAPLPTEVSVRGLVESFGAVVRAQSRGERNEARAEIARAGDAVKASFAQSTAIPPREGRDPRPLDEAIVGTWHNALMKVTFSADGRVATQMAGRRMDGRWSVDGGGLLRADITGRQQTAAAWIAGDQLTITVEGSGLTFTREGDA